MTKPNCEICGHLMPEGEEMFKFHGYSGPCPGPKLTPAPTGERAEALRLLNAAIENSWDGWFGDEDPNGDRENVRFIPYEDWDKLRDHFDIIRRALSQPVHCTGDAVEEWKNTIASFLGAFATCQKENQPDWMEYIAEEANKVCEAIGIHQRIVVNRRGNLGIEQMENDNA